MTDEELIAEARRLSPVYRHGGSDRDKYVGALLLELAALAERLGGPVPDEEANHG